MKGSEFVKKYKYAAINSAIRSGVYPSITLAQAILESGWGESSLSKAPYYNFFGIKGAGVNMPTTEWNGSSYVGINSNFRTYPNAKASFKDHAKFLQENSRYETNGVFAAKNYIEQAQALKKAGYATAPDYDQKLINLINQENLNRWDWVVQYGWLLKLLALGITLTILFFIGKAIYKQYNKSKK